MATSNECAWPALKALLSPNGRVLGDRNSADFKNAISRWSDCRRRQPFRIVQPATEQDVVVAVKELVDVSIAFVTQSGGHSPFSTIGSDGVLIDMSRFTGVDVDEANNLVTVKGGTLAKQLQTALHPYKRLVAIPSCSSVGVIPYYIGGGISTYHPFTGFACENVVSAKLVTAEGELVEVSETENPELFWGIRGAGQFFGLVTQITIKTLPYAALGNDQGQRMVGAYAFTPDKLDAVCAAILPVMEGEEHPAAGYFSVCLAPPDFRTQVIMAIIEVFASAEEAAEILRPLVDLGPVTQRLVPSTFDKHSDAFDSLSAKGGFKRFSQIGMTGFRVEEFRELVQLHSELVSACPDAARSAFTVEWYTRCTEPRPDTAFGNEGVHYWLNVLTWYEDAEDRRSLDEYLESMDKRAQQIVRARDSEDNFVTYTNTSRKDPVEWRYKGEARIARLKALKKQWDRTFFFTKQFLPPGRWLHGRDPVGE